MDSTNIRGEYKEEYAETFSSEKVVTNLIDLYFPELVASENSNSNLWNHFKEFCFLLTVFKGILITKKKEDCSYN